MKFIHLLYSHMKENAAGIVVIMLQMTVTVVVFNLFWSDFEEYLTRGGVYKALALDNAACLTVEDENDYTLTRLRQKGGIDVIGVNYNSVSFTSGSGANVTVQPVSPEYMEAFGKKQLGGLSDSESTSGALEAYISKSLSRSYRLGGTYLLSSSSGTDSITVRIAGIMKSDCMFIPPSDGTSSSIVSKALSTMLVCCDDETAQEIFGKEINSSVYTILARDRDTLENAAESIDLEKYSYMDARSAKENDDYSLLSEMGIPLTITIIVFVLCVANYSSYSMLSAIRREKEFAVYFISGATWGRCMRLQLIEDLFIVVVPLALSAVVCSALSLNRSGAVMSLQGLALSAGLCAVVMLLSSFAALLRIKGNRPVDLVRRRL